MNKEQPIILIEENEDDRELFAKIFSECSLKNNLICFNNFTEARQYIVLHAVTPFLLFSNVLQLHEKSSENYHEDWPLNYSLDYPCLFFSTLFSQCFVINTNSVPVHSYFVTPFNEDKFSQVIKTIVAYWKKNTKVHHG